MVAVVGTTITPYMQFYLQSAVAEKGIDEEELRLEQADAIGGAIWTNVIASSSSSRPRPRSSPPAATIKSAADAAQALEPVAGRLAELAVRGRAVRRVRPGRDDHADLDRLRDLRGFRLGVGRRQALRGRPRFFGIYTFVLVIGALVVLIPGLDLLPVILASQNLQGLLLPVVLVFMVLLVNDKRLMGRHANGRPLTSSPGRASAWSSRSTSCCS